MEPAAAVSPGSGDTAGSMQVTTRTVTVSWGPPERGGWTKRERLVIWSLRGHLGGLSMWLWRGGGGQELQELGRSCHHLMGR